MMSNYRGLPLALAGLIMLLINGPALAAELLMFERPGCPNCIAWEREIGGIYPLTAEGRRAPLRRIHIGEYQPNSVSLLEDVKYAPTFVLVEDGREIGRIVGYSSDDAFWGLLKVVVEKLTVK